MTNFGMTVNPGDMLPDRGLLPGKMLLFLRRKGVNARTDLLPGNRELLCTVPRMCLQEEVCFSLSNNLVELGCAEPSNGVCAHFFPILIFFREGTMARERALKVVLVVVGLIFVAFAYPLTQPKQSEVLQMFMGVYATLGVFLLIASRKPSANRSLIAFTAWSSLAHAAIMAVQSFMDAGERGHLIADVPALFLVAIVLAVLMRPQAQA